MAIDPRAFNLRQFAESGVANRSMFQGQLGIPPARGGGIIGPLEKYLTENSEVAAQPIVPNQYGQLASLGPMAPDMTTTTPGPGILQAPVNRFPGRVPEVPPEEPLPGPLQQVEPSSEPSQAEQVDSIIQATDLAADDDVNAGKVPPEDANAAKAAGEDQYAALLGLGDDATLPDILAALGLDGEYSAENYNKKAKELLDIDPNEEDVPSWAAPMFLFGLNLMQGPVSSQREGTGLLGGLLGDIGAAGEKGFAFFGIERERKRKEKAQIASLAMQLQSADVAQKNVILDAWRATETAKLDADKAVAVNIDKLTGRAMALAGPGDDPKTVAARLTAATSIFSSMQAFEAVGVTSRDYLKPEVTSFLLARAAYDIGAPLPDMKLESQTIGGRDYVYDPRALETAWSKYNKEHPNDKISHPSALFGMLVVNDPKVQKYQTLLTGARAPNTEFTSQTRVGGLGEEITDNIYTDKGALADWTQKWTQDNDGVAPTPTDVADNIGKFQGVVSSHLTKNPKMVQGSFIGSDQISHNFYYNPEALASRRRSQKNLTLEMVLQNPTEYPNIISGVTRDFSNLAPDMGTMTVGTGLKTKRVFTYDKTAYGLALDAGKIDITDPNVSVIDKMIELDIGHWAGKQWSTKDPQTMTVVSADGSIITATGEDAAGMVTGFGSAQEEAQWRNRGTGLAGLHRLAHQIHPLLLDEHGQFVASSATGIARFIESGVRLIGGLFQADAKPSQLTKLASANVKQIQWGDQTIVDGLTDTGREELQRGLEALKTTDTIFGGAAIKTDADRARVQSMFVNLAFALASAREGGKLTDNDVKNALMTLGWEGSSFTQTPEAILTTLKGAVQDASNSYFEEAVMRMQPSEKKKHAEALERGEGDVVEQLLRNFASQADPQSPTEIYQLYRNLSGGEDPFRISYHLYNQDLPSGDAQPVPAQAPALNQRNYTYGGQPFNYVGDPLTELETDVLGFWEAKDIPRSVGGVEMWFEKLTPDEKNKYGPVLKSLNSKGFFDVEGP